MRHLLFFAEDPGAFNYMFPLVQAGIPGFRISLVCEGIAREKALSHGLSLVPWDESEGASDFLQRLGINIIMVGTSENPHTRAFALIEQGNMPTVGFIDANMNSLSRFSGATLDPLAHAPEYLVVTDCFLQADFKKIGFSEDKIFVCGHPHFDFVKKFGEKKKKHAPTEKRHLLFVSEGSARLYKESFLQGREYYSSDRLGRTEVALENVLAAIKPNREKYHLRFRLHPKDKREDFSEFISKVDEVDAISDSLVSIAESDVVVGTTSMVMTEAAILGVPTLCILMNAAEANWLPSIRGGLSLVARNPQELLAGLTAASPIKDISTVFSFGAADKIRAVLAKI